MRTRPSFVHRKNVGFFLTLLIFGRLRGCCLFFFSHAFLSRRAPPRCASRHVKDHQLSPSTAGGKRSRNDDNHHDGGAIFAEGVEKMEAVSSVNVVVMSDGDESSMQSVAEFMVDSFWLNSPQMLVIGSGTVSDYAKSSLVEAQRQNLMEIYGERMGKKPLDSSVIKAYDDESGEMVGVVTIEVRLMNKASGIIESAGRSESTLRGAVASLGPKQRREYRNSPVRQIAAELLPPEVGAVACLSNLAISPGARRKGLAGMLCERAEEIASADWGYDEIYLKVEEENFAARRLYEDKLGYAQRFELGGGSGMRLDSDLGCFIEVPSPMLVLAKDISK